MRPQEPGAGFYFYLNKSSCNTSTSSAWLPRNTFLVTPWKYPISTGNTFAKAWFEGRRPLGLQRSHLLQPYFAQTIIPGSKYNKPHCTDEEAENIAFKVMLQEWGNYRVSRYIFCEFSQMSDIYVFFFCFYLKIPHTRKFLNHLRAILTASVCLLSSFSKPSPDKCL